MYHDSVVHLVNRTLYPIDVTYDGRPYEVPAGYAIVMKDGEPVMQDGELLITGADDDGKVKKLPIIAGAAKAAIAQHPVMGSQDPLSPYPNEFKLGVVEEQERFPITFLDVDDEPAELLDRSKLDPERQFVEFRAVGRKRIRGPKRRDPVTKRVVGADPSSRARYGTSPMDSAYENSMVGQTRD